MSEWEAVDLARQFQPDVAIVDPMIPDLNGLEATRQIRQASKRTQLLIFTMYHKESFVHDVLDVGARGYLLKIDAERRIVTAVETRRRRQPYFSAQISEIVLEEFLRLGRPGGEGAAAPRLGGRKMPLRGDG